MEYEEARKSLRYLISDKCTDTQSDYIDELELAIECIEKQIPHKVDTKTFYYGTLCPSCGELFERHMDNWKSPYCQYCGVKLDWGK